VLKVGLVKTVICICVVVLCLFVGMKWTERREVQAEAKEVLKVEVEEKTQDPKDKKVQWKEKKVRVENLRVVSKKEVGSLEEIEELPKHVLADMLDYVTVKEKLKRLRLEELIPESELVSSFAIPPSDKKIAYRVIKEDKKRIIKILDRKRKRVTELTEGWGPSFSPDEKKIVYVLDDGIYSINIDGTEKRQLTKRAPTDERWMGDGCPRWSPDGTKIAFYRDRNMWVMNADGSNQRQIGEGWDAKTKINWFPDSKRICYSVGKTIYVVDVETGKREKMAKGSLPSLSPDGMMIVYESPISTKDLPPEVVESLDFPSAMKDVEGLVLLDICIMNSDGSGAHVNLTNNSIEEQLYGVSFELRKFDSRPRWLDNRRVLFYCGHEEKWTIVTLEE